LEARAGIEGELASGIGFDTSETSSRVPAKTGLFGIISGTGSAGADNGLLPAPS
jgi:hypothetical protein